MYYIIYDTKTGEIKYYTSVSTEVYTDTSLDVLEIEELPEWFNDITKKPIVYNNTIIPDPNFVYKTPEEIRLENAKTTKFEEIKKAFSNKFLDGHFYSQALQMEVDYRRGNHNNDLQNVEGLIQIMELTSTNQVIFKGYTEDKLVTLDQLKQLTIEMKQYGLWLYQRKWQIEDYVQQATKISTIKAIPIDFESEYYDVGNAFELPEEDFTTLFP